MWKDLRPDTKFNLIFPVGIILISLLAVLLAPKFMGRVDEAKYAKAEIEIQNIEKLLDQYYGKYNRYPSNDEGLKHLYSLNNKDDENNFKLPLIDPWGTKYQYCYPGLRNKDKYDLWSYATDKLPGGEKLNQDITNWEINQKINK